jgi:hypothetical protein
MAVSFNLVKTDLLCLSSVNCLLAWRNLQEASGTLASAEGAYCLIDTVECTVPRRRKCIGQPCTTRNGEHAGSSMLLTAASRKSKWSNSYPSIAAKGRYSDAARRGFFDNLRQCLVFGFNRSDASAVKALCSPTDGIFSWRDNVIRNVRRCFPLCTKLEDKQLEMIGYLVEFFFDLLLSPSENVSQNPGFESCLGVYDGATRLG